MKTIRIRIETDIEVSDTYSDDDMDVMNDNIMQLLTEGGYELDDFLLSIAPMDNKELKVELAKDAKRSYDRATADLNNINEDDPREDR